MDVYENKDEDWLFGCSKNAVGLFPKNYVQEELIKTNENTTEAPETQRNALLAVLNGISNVNSSSASPESSIQKMKLISIDTSLNFAPEGIDYINVQV